MQRCDSPLLHECDQFGSTGSFDDVFSVGIDCIEIKFKFAVFAGNPSIELLSDDFGLLLCFLFLG